MSEHQENVMIKKLLKNISGVHPLIYIFIYLSAIPVFAGIYFFIPSGFYAPYARMEYSGQSDAYKTGILIQNAIIRSLHMRYSKSSKPAQRFKVIEDRLYVQRLSAIDNSKIQFDVLAMLWDEENKGNIQIPIHVIMQESSRIITYTSDYDTKTFRRVELVNEITDEFGNMINLAFSEIFRPTVSIFNKLSLIEFSREEDNELLQFFNGIRGNATSVSGAYGRMLYFSSMVITTVGFGDIVPMTVIARIFVASEAVLGVILAGLFLNAIAYRAAHGVQ